MPASDVITVERVEALLRGDPPCTADETRWAGLVTALRGASPAAPEALRARVLAAAPAARRRHSLPPRRLALVVLPAALAIAVGAAVVHGIVGSGPTVAGPPPVERTVVNGSAAAKPSPSVAAKSSAGAFSTAQPSVGNGSRLQHTVASLEVRVPDDSHLTSATTKATQIVTSLGGYAQSVVYRSARNGGGSAYLELRVPAQNARAAVARLGALGTLVSQQLSVTDLKQMLVAQSQRIAQLRRRVAALAKAVADPSLPDAQRVLLRIQLAEARRSLTQALHARSGTVASGVTASVSLDLTTAPGKAAVVHHRGRLGRMLHSAVGFLALEGTIVLYALVVLSPLVLLTLLVWWARAARRRRDERRLLAA
jgi:uncharacterized protein DUF4349